MAWAIPARLRAEGPDTVRRARLLLTLVVTLVIAGLSGVAFLLAVEPGQITRRLMVIALSAALGAAIPSVLRGTGSLTVAGNVGAGLAFFATGFVAFQTGGLGRPILGIQALVPLFAVLVAGVRWGVFWTVVACGELGVLYRLHLDGHAFPSPMPAEAQDLTNLVLTLMLLVVVLIFGVTYESLKNAALRHLEQANRKLTQARNEAEAATREAEEASRARSSFLATMSHEIRTPMNAVIGMACLLEETELTQEQAEYAATIRRAGESLLTILNDVLDFSKIESHKLEVESVPFETQATIEEAIDLLAIQAQGRSVELLYEISDRVPQRLVADPTRLRQILINLLSNAVKFTHDGEVHLSADAERREDGAYEIRFQVRDTGIGIPADRLDRLFESFSQVDASTTRKYGGTGLGLAIASRLAELMGGRMWVESQEEQGSTFHFTIVAQRASDVVSLREKQIASALRGKSVLIVDGNQTSRSILERLVQSWGMEATLCADGSEADRALRSPASYDVAVVARKMDGSNGTELAERIRRVEKRADLPLVCLSPPGAGRRETCAGAFSATIAKPVTPRALAAALGAALGQRIAAKSATSLPADMGETHPLRILVAEDNRVNQKVVLKLLERLGYRAEVAEDGVQALEAVSRSRFDVVLMDVQMPELDGIGAAREICARCPPEARPRLIALTASVLDMERRACLEAGMDDFLSKPVSVRALISALERCPRRADDPPAVADPDVRSSPP